MSADKDWEVFAFAHTPGFYRMRVVGWNHSAADIFNWSVPDAEDERYDFAGAREHGEPWPIEPCAAVVEVLEREYE